MDGNVWFVILGVAVVAGLAWAGLRLGSDFTIRVARDGVRVKGAIPAARKREIERFFADDLAAPAGATVSGRRLPGGRLKLRFRRLPNPGDRQRVRNLLTTVL